MESTEAGDQACTLQQDSISTGDQAKDCEDILDFEPEEEEEQGIISLSEMLERNGDQARKFTKIRSNVPRCDICSQKHLVGYDTGEIHHIHFSSKVTDSTSSSALKSPEGRIKICVTDSTLHEQWEDVMITAAGGSFQVMWISIPGARIGELMAAWEIEFRDEVRPMDVMLMGGVFNVAKGSPGPNILSSMTHFMDLVVWQGERLHPSEPNTCVVATMSYPPSLCWFDDDGPVPTNFENHLRNMRWLNHRIEALNLQAGIKAPNFPTLGIRKENKFGVGTTRHRLQQWQGSSRREKIYVSRDIQKKMCRQISKYFVHNTEKPGSPHCSA